MQELPPDADAGFVLDGPDGPVAVPFRRAAPPAGDPFVRDRLVDGGGGVVTAYAPAPARPPSYPVSLPFLPGRPAWTTEVGDPAGSAGVRGRSGAPDDVAAVLAAARAACAAEGWRPARLGEVPFPTPPVEYGGTAEALVRGGHARVLATAPPALGGLVQLLELPPGAPGPAPAGVGAPAT